MLELKPLLGILCMIALTVGANVMLKLGAMVAPAWLFSGPAGSSTHSCFAHCRSTPHKLLPHCSTWQ